MEKIVWQVTEGCDEKGCEMDVDEHQPDRKEQDDQRRPVEKCSGRRQLHFLWPIAWYKM